VNAFDDIFAQYFDEASFLWILRSIAVEQPHYKAADLLDIEQRLDAQLDALLSSIDQAWEACEAGLQMEDSGETFTAAVIAFKSHEIEKIQKVVKTGLLNERSSRGLVSALGWVPENIAKPWVAKFFSSKDLEHKYLAVAACSIRRMDPAELLVGILQRDDCLQHEKLYARAVRLIGELKRVDLRDYLQAAMASDSESVKFWSNWSAALMGDKAALQNMEPFVFQPGPYQTRAVQLVFRLLSIEQSRNWISRLMANTEQMRTVITATGILGDPHAVGWLLQLMNQSAFSRLAGEAFCTITGIDFVLTELVGEIPVDYEAKPKDDTDDEDVSLDEDENLSWPDAEKVSLVWRQISPQFISGKRYFLGQEISAEFLLEKISTSYQRQRHYAAMEFAASDPEQRFPNVKMKMQD